MSRSRAIAVTVALCLSAPLGCGSGAKAKVDDTTTVDKIAELRAQRRRDRKRLRELEEKMADVAKDSYDRGDVSALPVERLGPTPVADQGEPNQPEVVAIADDGTEIVYVGEAAQDRTVAADTRLLRQERRAPSPRPRATRRPRRTSSPPIVLTAPTSDSLGVTSRRLPRVGEVTKRLPPAPKAREAKATPRPRPRRPGNAPAGAVADYQRHVAALKAGKHKQAIAGFRRFVRRYARSDYADNAQYWLGEAFYDRKMFDKALVEFNKVAASYPTGNKVPDAKLKAAYCMLNLGDVASAKVVLSSLIEEFPDSRIAQLAGEKLERLAD